MGLVRLVEGGEGRDFEEVIWWFFVCFSRFFLWEGVWMELGVVLEEALVYLFFREFWVCVCWGW